MEKLKEFFAFPMFATSLWLCWLLEKQIGPNAWVITSVSFMSLVFCLWLAKFRGRIFFIIAIAGSLATAVTADHFAAQSKAAGHIARAETNSWKKYSVTEIRQLRSEHKSIFVDFTASWCVTCQINKKTTLDLDSTMALFHEHATELRVADWTDEDPEITQALSEFGRNSVPLYVYYAPDKEPMILPQILTYDIMQNTFK